MLSTEQQKLMIIDMAPENEHPCEWDSPEESRNPRNWGVALKAYHTIVPCLVAFLL